MQFDDIMSCLACEQQQQQQINISSKQKKDYESFLSKYNQLIGNINGFSSHDDGGGRVDSSGGGVCDFYMEDVNQTLDTSDCQTCSFTNKIKNTNFSNSRASSRSSTRNSSPNDTNHSSYTIEAKPSDLMNTLGQLVPCIGCRTSVERFYKVKKKIFFNIYLIKILFNIKFFNDL
jgi:hypothetical protein